MDTCRHTTHQGLVFLVEPDEFGLVITVEGTDSQVIIDDGGEARRFPTLAVHSIGGDRQPGVFQHTDDCHYLCDWDCETCGSGCQSQFRTGVRGILRDPKGPLGFQRCDACGRFESDFEATQHMLDEIGDWLTPQQRRNYQMRRAEREPTFADHI